MSAMLAWVIYEKPSDFSEQYVIRIHNITDEGLKPTHYFWVVDSIDKARACVPSYLVRFVREEADEKQIVETWL
jgi:hypothetical protein